MNKYYITVSLMQGNNRMIKELNERVVWFRDALVSCDAEESIKAMYECFEQETKALNAKYPRCKPIVCRFQDGGETKYISIGYHTEQQATIWFHKISKEL